MLQTQLCELLGIEVPILGAPMGPEITSRTTGLRASRSSHERSGVETAAGGKRQDYTARRLPGFLPFAD
jgi:hypothetical protein